MSTNSTQYKINLIKEREQKVTISLKKKTDEIIQCHVNLILDVSGSMYSMYSGGEVQKVVERICPIAFKFTPNQQLGMYIFSDICKKLTLVNINNFEDYVQKEILNKRLLGGNTDYAPVMNLIVNDNDKVGNNINNASIIKILINKIKSFFKLNSNTKKLILEKENNNINKSLPTYNIFITDGNNSDKKESEHIIINSSNKPYYWQFVGIGNENFSFLKKLDDLQGRFIDNANFFQLDDISSISDEELYDRLLNEFPNWLKEARSKRIVN